MGKSFCSKGKYVRFVGCKKLPWLEKYKKELWEDKSNQSVLDAGNEVGDLAMGLFGDYYLAETKDNNIPIQIQNTKNAIMRGERVICEAAFSVDNNYCAVDILIKNDDGSYNIYEVKSSTGLKDEYVDDISYQYYVLTKANLIIKDAFLIVVNTDYNFSGTLEIDKFFKFISLTDQVKGNYNLVKENLSSFHKVLQSPIEPETNISKRCLAYNGCPFSKYCFKLKGIPETNSILELYNSKKKFDFIGKGILSFEDLDRSKEKKTKIQNMQLDFALGRNLVDTYIDKTNIKMILEGYNYPIYFLDFEGIHPAIPVYENTRPYEQVAFQYSLHILEEDGSLSHKYFLGDGVNNPSEDLAKSLTENIGDIGSVVVYNSSYEKNIIKGLYEKFPLLESKLKQINQRIVDLENVFTKGYYYNKAMRDSFSIKSVLPALFLNDESLNYNLLEQVHNGDEAPRVYLNLKNMEKEQRESSVKNLLNYCHLDTLSMVKIFQKLNEEIS